MIVMAGADTTQYRQQLTAHPEALAGIRRVVSECLHRWGFGQLAEAATLCVHELLANVDKHTDSPECVLTLQRRATGVRVVVSDTSIAMPKVREPDWIAESGRGLVVLTKVADAWGTVLRPGGKDVWMELHAEATDV